MYFCRLDSRRIFSVPASARGRCGSDMARAQWIILNNNTHTMLVLVSLLISMRLGLQELLQLSIYLCIYLSNYNLYTCISYIYIYIYTHIHTYIIHIYIYIYTYISYIYIHTYIYIYTSILCSLGLQKLHQLVRLPAVADEPVEPLVLLVEPPFISR